VKGTVVSVEAVSAGNGKRAATYIMANYELGGGTIKRLQLNSRGVQLAEDETTASESAEPMTELGAEDVGAHFHDTIEFGTPLTETEGILHPEDALEESADVEDALVPAAPLPAVKAPVEAAGADDPRATVATVNNVEWQRGDIRHRASI
jgi:hypothetical protein